MQPVWILLLAIGIVLVGILVLRLHAFLALLLAALTVAWLSSTSAVERTEIESRALRVSAIDPRAGTVSLRMTRAVFVEPGMRLLLLAGGHDGSGDLETVGEIEFVAGAARDGQTGTARLVQLTGDPAPEAARCLAIHPLKLAEARRAGRVAAPVRVAKGFGATCTSIGILIAMASIIGKCLLDSGAADRIVRSTLAVVGQARAPLAFLGSGFLLGIPVFFDTVFYLMVPLGKAMRLRTGGNYLLYILTIVAGGTMAHSLVPPTPGPLFVAESMGVSLMTMIAVGCAVGVVASLAGYAYALWINRRLEIPLRDSAEASLADLEALASRDASQLPPTWLSLLPIVLPVLLIAAQTGLKTYLDGTPSAEQPAWLLAVKPAVDALGDKNVALVIAAAIALATLAWQKRSSGRELTAAVQMALAGGGVIILITSAGGAFGDAVRQCGIADQIARLTEGVHPVWILPIAFTVTALIRTAQGSATVAMITSVGVLQSLATSDQLPFHPVYLAMAIGCGSKPVAWMADSGFWVICKMSGMTEAEGLKTVSPMSVVMGVAGLLATIVGANWLPLK
ncbi:MAG: gluconate permease [Pirellulaceae bacterium]|nr:gluconate permease [Pirellulaceae bacterium]